MRLPIPFANPATYDGHSGVDYPQPRGAVIRASGPGTVTTLSRNDRGGFYIWVQYDEGPLVGYHHMDSHAGCPPRWSRVVEGSQLGYVGNSGFSTGPHLHSEVSGHASTSGYWRFFDPTRVVGDGTPAQSEEDDMTPTQANQLAAVYAALFGPANVGVEKTTWKKPFGEPVGEAYYGMFDVLIASQQTLAQNAGKLAALETAVGQLSAGSGVALDMGAIEDAAERGAKDALAGLTLIPKVD